MTALLSLRRDLRIHDHPALEAARRQADVVVPVFCFDDRILHGRHASGPRTQFLLESLTGLDSALRQRGSRLVVRSGDPAEELLALAHEVGADTIHASVDAGPLARRRDLEVARRGKEAGIRLCGHPGVFVVDDLAAISTSAGTPYTVFTPFYRAWVRQPRRDVHGTPRKLAPPPRGVDPGRLPKLSGLRLQQTEDSPVPGGERAGREAMNRFLRHPGACYDDGHDDLDSERVSRLSPYLHFGCLSPRELEGRLSPAHDAFRRQLAWRDFFAHVLRHFPANAQDEHQERFRRQIKWTDDRELFEAWCEGQTGFPLVDAAMRQLGTEGWMHNRARLVVGSFLTKDLGIDWRWGERHFMSLLLDGDEASNNGNWQWIASVGVDPQPVSRRIFNPTLQQQRFDPHGRYVRRYVPELRDVPDDYLTEPWTMPDEVQRDCGCVIGQDYPEPIVDHKTARREALARYGAAG